MSNRRGRLKRWRCEAEPVHLVRPGLRGSRDAARLQERGGQSERGRARILVVLSPWAWVSSSEDGRRPVRGRGFFRRDTEVGEKAPGPDHAGVATMLGSQGVLMFNRKDFDAAVPLLQRSVGISGKALGPTDPRSLPGRLRLAASLRLARGFDEARASLQPAVDAASDQHMTPELRAEVSEEQTKLREARASDARGTE